MAPMIPPAETIETRESEGDQAQGVPSHKAHVVGQVAWGQLQASMTLTMTLTQTVIPESKRLRSPRISVVVQYVQDLRMEVVETRNEEDRPRTLGF